MIGGSGFYRPDLLSNIREEKVETPYGEIQPLIGKLGKLEVAFLPRHGQDHSVLPHQINYRANLWGLHSLGVKRIIATTAVGSLSPELAPGTMVIVDQFLDFTKQRPLTFWESGDVQKAHIDMTDPYCPAMRMELSKAAAKLNMPVQIGGCYVCFEGPRYETAAEIKMFRMLGGTVVGMTGIPETVLARELGICYANLSIVTNWAAGISVAPLSHAEV
ncbi:MAG TPA: S-methyl-5'-thioinosine phosphorylase, partial [Firmicutes bacterium]|nr:S-methyl-5'-thioinosine phosphorylase [Bacillota bacterium]